MIDYIIKSSRIITAQGIISGSVGIQNGKIEFVCSGNWEASHANAVIDVHDDYVSPGFIELHSHGGGGYDFMDESAKSFYKSVEFHRKHGTTQILPTSVASSYEEVLAFIERYKYAENDDRIKDSLLGVHLEGPYLNKSQCGAQNSKYIRNPEEKEYKEIMKQADGRIRRWSLAPELPGALKFVDCLIEHNILPSIGHSDAEYEDVIQAFDHGVRGITHFYSGMSMIHRRNGYRYLGVVESSYLLDDIWVEIIADGCHLPYELIKLIIKIKGKEKVCLVTDSMRGAGMPEGETVLGDLDKGQKVIIENGVAKLPDRSGFAGSVATADHLIRVLNQKVGVKMEDSVAMMTRNPAIILGIANQKGDICQGYDADIIVFDENINIKMVMVAGRVINDTRHTGS